MRIFHEPVTLRGYLLVSALGLGVAVVAAKPAKKPAPAPVIAVDITEPVATDAPPQTTREEQPASAEIKLVFDDAGATYLALEDLSAVDLPRHGTFSNLKDATTTSAFVARENVPRSARAWIDQKVMVDGTCEAKVIEFAIVARVSGDAPYADDDNAPSSWTTQGILDRGHVMLAAKLDRCTGTFARAASAPPIRPFVDVGGGNIDEARRRVIASEPGLAAATEWTTIGQKGQWFEHTDITTKTLRDPRTGRIWISMHAHSDLECGGPNINIWGLFRVENNGALTTVQLRELGTLVQIDHLIDTDGDGMPELVGRGWVAPDAMITTAAGDELVRLDTPFFGCPC